MSYILDALKKADAERERSAVPGLHAHPQDDPAGRERREGGLAWPVIAVATIVLLGGALTWLLLSDRGVRTPPLTAQAPAMPEQAPAPTPSPAPAPAMAPVTPPPAPSPGPTAAAPAPAPVAAPPAAAVPAPAARDAPTLPKPKPAPPPPAAPKPAAPPTPRVPSLNELPPDVRASLPQLAISGAVFSPTPSARMLFINGQVLREGQAVADGVTVERIGASASVLSARGVLFELKH